MKTIPLTKGYFAKVDDDDHEFLSQWKWHVSLSRSGGKYAKRVDTSSGGRIKITMHRLLMRVSEHQKVDHFDGDGLNNQKSNLRRATQLQNGKNKKMSDANSTGFKGVSLHRATSKFKAQISSNGKGKHIGLFATPREAAVAYDREALAMHGEFAFTNHRLGLL